MAPLVRWFGARGWSSKVARGSLAHACLSAVAEARAEGGAFAGRRRASRAAGADASRRLEETPKTKTTRRSRRFFCARSRACARAATARTAPASPWRVGLSVTLRFWWTAPTAWRAPPWRTSKTRTRRRTPSPPRSTEPTTRRTSAAVAAFAASRDALENVDENSDEQNTPRDAFDSAAHAVRAMETHAARRYRAESMCRRRYRGGDGCLTRVVDAGAGALFAFRHDDAKEGSAFKRTAPPPRFWRTSLAQPESWRASAAGGDSGRRARRPRGAQRGGGGGRGFGEGRRARARARARYGHTQKAETGDGRSVGHRRRRRRRDERRRRRRCAPPTLGQGQRRAARTAAPLWSTPKSEMTKTKTPSAFAVARLLVRGEDGHDKMRDRAVDANLGPERDLDDVEKALRASSAPLAFALAASLESDFGGGVRRRRRRRAEPRTRCGSGRRRVSRSGARGASRHGAARRVRRRERRGGAAPPGAARRASSGDTGARTPSASSPTPRSETVFGGPRLIYESDIDTYLHVLIHVENSRAGLLIKLVRVRLRLYARVGPRRSPRHAPARASAPPSSRLGKSRPRRSAPGLPPSPWWCAWWCACSRLTRT